MLAAAMDSRGYGRCGTVPARRRRLVSALLLGGLVAACIGVFALVSADSPVVLGLPMLVIGVGTAIAGMALAGHATVRTRYRPDPWRLPEWLVGGAGVVAALLIAGASWLGADGLAAAIDPPAWPQLPLVGLVTALVAATPALTAPPLPVAARPARGATADRATLEVAA
jgi:energy-coupling factor transport system permease protein